MRRIHLETHIFIQKGMAAALVAAVTAVASLPSQMLGFAADAVPAADATWEENLSLLASSSIAITKSAGYFEGLMQNGSLSAVQMVTMFIATAYRLTAC